MTDAIIFAPWQSVEGRYLAAAHAAGFRLCAAATEQDATSRLYRDPDRLGIIWARGQETAANYVRQARLAGVKNIVLVMLHQDGDADELSQARAAVLMAGADDCQPAAIEIVEITARLKALLQRGDYNNHLEIALPGAVYSHRDGWIDCEDGRRIHLTKGEGSLLVDLARRPGLTRTKEQIMDAMYGGEDEPGAKIVDVWVCKLRRKIANATGGLDCIVTEWGRGWRWEPAGYTPALHIVRRRASA